MRRMHFLFVLLVATHTMSGSPASWAQFRGPGGLGTAPESAWRLGSEPLWQVPLPGPGTGSPIVAQGKIFLACYSGSEPGSGQGAGDALKLHACCLAREDGRLLWSKTLAPSLPEQERIREDQGYASSTPAADADAVFFFFGKSGLFAFDLDGNQKWKAGAGSGLSGWGSAASPVLYQELVIVNASVESESLVAFDKATGAEKWRAPGIVEAWNTPLLVELADGRTELIVGIPKKVLGLDPGTGRRLWECDTGIQWYMCPSAVVQGDIVYMVGGRSGDGLAVRAGGKGNVTATHLVWRIKKGSNVPSPLYHNGHLYFAHDNLGILYCFSAQNGEMLYEERLSPGPGQIYASPILVGEQIIYLSRGGELLIVPGQPELTGVTRHRLPRGVYNASPIVDGSRVLLRSNQYLFCLGTAP